MLLVTGGFVCDYEYRIIVGMLSLKVVRVKAVKRQLRLTSASSLRSLRARGTLDIRGTIVNLALRL